MDTGTTGNAAHDGGVTLLMNVTVWTCGLQMTSNMNFVYDVNGRNGDTTNDGDGDDDFNND